jgi:predicted dehydrogenase
MALDITPEQRATGKANFTRASDELSRRGFLKVLLAGGAVAPVGAAAYFGYQYEKLHKNPVRAGLIGAGDEGGVLVGEHNPSYLQFIAYSDIRPYNQERIFKGQGVTHIRKGFNYHYGSSANKKIKLYENYRDLLANKDIEAVVIALPLHLHAPVAIEAMRAGKHVLCEKLMAWNISQCKEMIRVAEETDRILSIGHQRHYSLLYAQAAMAVQAGVLGDIKHIRALWHRNNSWPERDKNGNPTGRLIDSWSPKIPEEDRKALPDDLLRSKYDYKNLEELVRWRLFHRTGGGLMAELGSHQLDACSIFLTANAKKNFPGEGPDFKLMPLAVSGVGGKYFYEDNRDAEDSVFVTFEFPGPDYYARDKDGRSTGKVKKPNDKVIVTYSSLNTNELEKYGECLMGSRGSMVVEEEQTVMLFAERDKGDRNAGPPRSTAVTVTSTGGGQPILDSTSSSAPGPAAAAGGGGGGDAAAGPVSRGYREEMEHFAYCIRMRDQAMEKDRPQVRCHGKVAMADAIMALTSNLAMRQQKRIEFNPAWFDPKSKEVPDADVMAVDHEGKEIRL